MDQQLEQITKEDNGYQQLVELKNKRELRIKLLEAQKDLKIQYWQILLQTIEIKDKRPTAEKILTNLKTLLHQFKDENQEDLKKYDENQMEQLEDELSTFETDKQVEAKSIVAGRIQKMATIYKEGKLQYLRRRLRI